MTRVPQRVCRRFRVTPAFAFGWYESPRTEGWLCTWHLRAVVPERGKRVGWIGRNHMVPVPEAVLLAELNALIDQWARRRSVIIAFRIRLCCRFQPHRAWSVSDSTAWLTRFWSIRAVVVVIDTVTAR